MIIKTTRTALYYFGAFLLLAVFGFAGQHVSAATLSAAEQKQCMTDWDGNTYDLSKPKQVQKLKDFKNTNCFEGNGSGTCAVTTRVDNDPTSDTFKHTFASIDCTPNSGGNTGGGGGGDGITDPALTAGGCTGENCAFIDAYINPFIKLLSALVGIVAIIFIIFGAIQVITSAGDPQKSARGKDHIRNALIGLVAFVLLYAILNWLIPGGIA